MNQRDVCPQDLRFTQDSIKNTFKPPHESQRIDDAVDRIRRKLLSASDFPPMNVVDHNNILWCLDNRRLWIFRQASVPAVKVNLVPQKISRRSEEFFLNLDPRLEKRFSRPTYFPRVRGRVELQDTAPLNTEHLSPETSQKPRRTTATEEPNPEAKNAVPKETCHVAEEPPLQHKTSIMVVSPQDLKFTQGSIKITFEPPHEFQRIDDAVDRIRKKLLSPSDFPPMNVVDHKNILWCLDNRRLWVFRRAGVPAVKVNLVPHKFSRRSEEFFLNLNPLWEELFSCPTYFPPVIGPVEFQDTAPPNTERPSPKTSQTPRIQIVAEEPNPEAKKTVPKKTCHVAEEPPLQHKTGMMVVCPQDLRFTRDYVKNTFDPPNRDHPPPRTSQSPRRRTDAEEPPFEGLGVAALIALGVGYVAVKAFKMFFR